jgi:hypothetical protein
MHKKQEDKRSRQNEDGKLHYFYDNNKVHFSICLFFAFWLAASVNWIFEDQEAPGVLIADVLYYLGYASFGYFLYSLYYHFFRKEFEPFILILIAVIILVPLIFIVDTIVSTLRLLSIQTVDISVVIVNAVYPILDAAGDSGFAYTSAFDVTTVQNYIWIWNIFYNSDHLCLAAALIGYKHFFLGKIDVQHP